MSLKRLRLAKDIAHRVSLGHPWVYREAIAQGDLRGLPRGSAASLVDRQGGVVAHGFVDPDGPIAFRVLARAEKVSEELVYARVASAMRLRKTAAGGIDSDGVRLLHGEGDFVPGLVMDVYATTGVLRYDGAAARAFWRPYVPVVLDACRAGGFRLERLWARGGRGEDGEVEWGDAPPASIVICEGEARYRVDVVRGQKTGFFLDQRDNRRLVGTLSADASVLNLFAYTGGFSVAAALGGARRVTTVDLARPAVDAARQHLRDNGIPEAAHELVCADAFAFLAAARASGRRWDLVVCDPPSFAPSDQAHAKALGAYLELNRAALSVVEPGGLLGTASCSSHVTCEELVQVVAQAAVDLRRDVRVIARRGAGPDHPVVPAFPEGQYLKFLLLCVD
jgi:23S rRNA (cytosine1962-C5)-methyltransferase